MAQHSTQPMGIQHNAEGSPNYYEDGEHNLMDPSQYNLINKTERITPSSETGLIAAVNLLASEGKDDEDSQDASLTKDETKAAPAPVAERSTNPEAEANAAPSVLIIEDNAELAEIIQATLERMNFVTAHESHGTKAIEKVKTFNPEVVLLDIGLPDMTGWNIMDAIKEHKQKTGKQMPKIIVITAYDDPANRLVGKLQGVHNYLIKPFTADEIERVVTQAMNADD